MKLWRFLGSISTLHLALAVSLLVFTLVLANFFDAMGTMTGLGRQANLLDEKGQLPNIGRALVVEGAGAVAGGAAALDFYRRAFGAEELFRFAMPDGRLGHAEIRIGDSIVMLSDEFPEFGVKSPRTLGGTPVTIHLYVEDVDALYAATQQAKKNTTAPTLIVLHTIIAWPAPTKQDTGASHGSALGEDEVADREHGERIDRAPAARHQRQGIGGEERRGRSARLE